MYINYTFFIPITLPLLLVPQSPKFNGIRIVSERRAGRSNFLTPWWWHEGNTNTNHNSSLYVNLVMLVGYIVYRNTLVQG